MQSKAATVAGYLKELPEDRRAAITKVRAVIRKNLPKGFVEQMGCRTKLYPAGYHCDPKLPMPFANLASQKNYMSFYLMSLYSFEPWLRQQFLARGKKLDMGKCCIRFKTLEDLPLDVIGEAVGKISLAEYIIQCEDAVKLSKARKRAKEGRH